jgi:serine/threonine protein phosphatase PrpC
MKLLPYQVKAFDKDIRSLVRDGSLPSSAYDAIAPFLKAAEQTFPSSYTLTSLKGPTVGTIACQSMYRSLAIAYAPGTAPPSIPDAWECSAFARVLSRSDKQLKARQWGPLQEGESGLREPMVSIVDVAERTNHASRKPYGWGLVRLAELAGDVRERSGEPSVAGTTYPESDISIVSMGCPMSSGDKRTAFEHESAHMTRAMTNAVDSMIHAAITSLLVPKSLMEIRAALKRAFSTSWYASLCRGKCAVSTSTHAGEDAAIFLLSIVQYRKHLFVANVGKIQAFLWKDNRLRPLSVLHDGTDAAESRRAVRPRKLPAGAQDILRAENASRALFKFDTEASIRPQVTCLRLTDVVGGLVVVASPGLFDAIGAMQFEQTLAAVKTEDAAEQLARRARANGFKQAASVFAIPMTAL